MRIGPLDITRYKSPETNWRALASAALIRELSDGASEARKVIARCARSVAKDHIGELFEEKHDAQAGPLAEG